MTLWEHTGKKIDSRLSYQTVLKLNQIQNPGLILEEILAKSAHIIMAKRSSTVPKVLKLIKKSHI